jgi:hypothetical protein
LQVATRASDTNKLQQTKHFRKAQMNHKLVTIQNSTTDKYKKGLKNHALVGKHGHNSE